MIPNMWYPICRPQDVPKQDSVGLRRLGEDLVLFRDPSGKLGLIERYCAHRRVSLEFGRVEEGGIRCC